MADRIALITGGAQGIGFACAEALANDGCKIVLADIKESVIEAGKKIKWYGIHLRCQ